MYLPTHFAETRIDVMHELIRAHPFGTLAIVSDGELTMEHLPFVLDAGQGACGVLRGHVARANPAWRLLDDGRRVTAAFHGPQTYVSPHWYPSKRQHGKVVPTWNYAMVHAHGTARAIEDSVWLRSLLERLTDTHESSSAVPWRMSDAPEDFTTTMMGAVVGVELVIDTLQGKWKMSQNRSAADRQGVANELAARSDDTSRTIAGLVAADS